ncbi:MAG: glutamate--tRNA ligase [Bacteroidia bacterium]|nr:glutamate--tRNA ligase [Bacteroidia bacterium]
MVRVRFAPSPTGPLHIGGVRTALFNYLFAKKHHGDFLLRIEDTDQNRYVPGAEEYIIKSLAWCGIEFDYGPHLGGPDAPYRQSERKAIYRQYAEQLVTNGTAYYAFDTEADLEIMRQKLEAAGVKSPQYNAVVRSSMKNSLTLPAGEVKQRIENQEPYVIRLKVPRKEEIRFHDEIRGWVVVHSSQIDDKVLLKSDGMPTYHLANVVDDHLMHITHVIRGEEWLPSTPLHILLYRAFGWEETMPKFAHLPLLLKPDGNGKLSKRDGDRLGFPVFPLTWKDPETGEISSGYKEAGYLPEAFINFLALLGWNPGNDHEVMSKEKLIELFSLERVGKSGTKFDQHKAAWFNQTYLRALSDENLLQNVKPILLEHNYSLPDDFTLIKILNLLKERVTKIPEFATIGDYFFKPIQNYDAQVISKKWNPESRLFIENIITAWKDVSDWHSETLHKVAQEVAEKQGVQIGKVLQIFRLALTGSASGPALFEISELLGKDTCLRNLQHTLNTLPTVGFSNQIKT